MDVELAEERILVLADRFNLDMPKAAPGQSAPTPSGQWQSWVGC
jgi:hypothetical protein